MEAEKEVGVGWGGGRVAAPPRLGLHRQGSWSSTNPASCVTVETLPYPSEPGFLYHGTVDDTGSSNGYWESGGVWSIPSVIHKYTKHCYLSVFTVYLLSSTNGETETQRGRCGHNTKFLMYINPYLILTETQY